MEILPSPLGEGVGKADGRGVFAFFPVIPRGGHVRLCTLPCACLVSRQSATLLHAQTAERRHIILVAFTFPARASRQIECAGAKAWFCLRENFISHNSCRLHSFCLQLPAVREKRKKCDFSFFEYFLIDRELVTTPRDVARGRRQATVEGACTKEKRRKHESFITQTDRKRIG